MTMEYSPLPFLDTTTTHSNSSTTGLIILNTPIPSSTLLASLWHNSTFRVCADGGANRLHDLPSLDSSSYIPDEITGDLDSVRPSVRELYTSHGTTTVRDDDQYATDFNKSVARVIARVPGATDILVLGSLGGRVDHGLGLISELGKEAARHPGIKLWLFTERSVSFVLPEGEARVRVPRGMVTENVGVVPVYGEARITLKGFEWDVEDWETRMGELVSTSNHLRKEVVEVKTDVPVLFTVELDL